MLRTSRNHQQSAAHRYHIYCFWWWWWIEIRERLNIHSSSARAGCCPSLSLSIYLYRFHVFFIQQHQFVFGYYLAHFRLRFLSLSSSIIRYRSIFSRRSSMRVRMFSPAHHSACIDKQYIYTYGNSNWIQKFWFRKSECVCCVPAALSDFHFRHQLHFKIR